MDEGKARTVGHWLRKARHDLRSAHRLYTDAPPLLGTAAYHCQQAAEKALKGWLMGPTVWLAFWDRRVARGHARDDAADAECNSAIPGR